MSLLDALQKPLTELAESALNHALSLDPATRAALMEELGTPLGIRMEPPGLALTLERSGDRVRLSVNDDSTCPSAVVHGTPLALLSLALGDRTPMDQGRLVMTGDEQRIASVTRVLADLDPDLESVLADIMGDVPAHVLAQRLRRLLDWTQQANGALMANVEDYIQEEAGVVPPRNEAEVVFDDIHDLQTRTDELEARIDALEHTTGTESP